MYFGEVSVVLSVWRTSISPFKCFPVPDLYLLQPPLWLQSAFQVHSVTDSSNCSVWEFWFLKHFKFLIHFRFILWLYSYTKLKL